VDIGRIAVETVSCRVLAEDAHALANIIDRPVYDALYLTLAVRLNTRMITADDRLEAALSGFPELAAHIQHIRSVEIRPS
jgi:predicted nucleic acid-binding protein